MATMPTQSAYPWKATLRTVLAVVVALGIVGPLILGVITEQLGNYISPDVMGYIAWGVGLIVAISATVTRIMAIPQVNAWLTKWLGLGATPKANA
jgi:hypothetical protein